MAFYWCKLPAGVLEITLHVCRSPGMIGGCWVWPSHAGRDLPYILRWSWMLRRVVTPGNNGPKLSLREHKCTETYLRSSQLRGSRELDRCHLVRPARSPVPPKFVQKARQGSSHREQWSKALTEKVQVCWNSLCMPSVPRAQRMWIVNTTFFWLQGVTFALYLECSL